MYNYFNILEYTNLANNFKFEEFISCDESYKIKKSTSGEFITLEFFQEKALVATVNIKLKKGWNQFHIDIDSQFRGKGLSKEIFEETIKLYNYVSIPEGRILNPIIYKIVEGFKKDKKYEVFETEYEEYIISNKKIDKKEILKIFK